MKKYKILIAIICISMFSLNTGCKKELETTNYSQFSSVDFPKTEKDIISSLTPFYSLFSQQFGAVDPGSGETVSFFYNAYSGYGYQTSILTDEFLDLWGMQEYQYLHGPASQELMGSYWYSLYKNMRFVGKATEMIDRISQSPVSDEIKNKYIAELKGLRAWIMFTLYDFYGPLNVKLDPATLTDKTIEPRLSKEAYIAAMIKDITEAMPDLPDKLNDDAQNWGRMSKGILSMVALKLYMHEKDWSNAKTVCESLLGLGYSLMPAYKDVFMVGHNNELIYAAPGNDGLYSDYYVTMLPSDCANVCGVDVEGGWDGYLMPWAFYDKYDPADKRLETIGGDYITSSGDTKTRDNGLQGAVPLKYLNFESLNQHFEFVVFRYADVLLSMAEILNELNGPTAEAIGYAQQVTDRAGTIIPVSATSDKNNFSEFLLDERGRELYLEPGIRRQDLIRHGTLISNARERGMIAADDKHLLYPIPSDIIIVGGGVITQNPGYNE